MMTEISVAGDSTHSASRTEPLSQAVVAAVAESEGVDPLALDVPLYEAIDPDALDALFQSSDGEPTTVGRIVFTYYGYEVTVSSDGQVTLEETVDA